MRAGKLDRTIVVQRATVVGDDGYGNQILGWAPLATLRAQLVQSSTEEFIRDSGAAGEEAVVFRTRFLDGVSIADRVAYGGHTHNIVELKEIGRRRGLELRTVRLGAT